MGTASICLPVGGTWHQVLNLLREHCLSSSRRSRQADNDGASVLGNELLDGPDEDIEALQLCIVSVGCLQSCAWRSAWLSRRSHRTEPGQAPVKRRRAQELQHCSQSGSSRAYEYDVCCCRVQQGQASVSSQGQLTLSKDKSSSSGLIVYRTLPSTFTAVSCGWSFSSPCSDKGRRRPEQVFWLRSSGLLGAGGG